MNQTQVFWKGNTHCKDAVSSVSCSSNRLCLLADIGLTSPLTERACLLSDSGLGLGLFHSVRAVDPELLTCGRAGKVNKLKEVHVVQI